MLSELRKKYTDLIIKGEALLQAATARMEEAKEAKRELEKAALAGLIDEARQLMDDLKAMNEAYRTIQAGIAEARHEFELVKAQITSFYDNALKGGPKVDWKIRLEWAEKSKQSDWGGRHYNDDYVCLVNTELCDCELESLKSLLPGKWSIVPWGENYRLKVLYNEYRGSCWADYGGEKIAKAISSLLEVSDFTQEVDEFLETLEVLGGKPKP